MLVMIVDDDADIRLVVRTVVEREGFEVVEAADGATAMTLVEQSPPHVIILDLHLPDIGGLDLLAELRDRDPDARVIVLTGAGSETDRVRGLVSGADDYVVKPFSARELAARVIACSRRRPARARETLEFADVVIDPESRVVTVAGEVVEVPRREFDLLHYLATHAGRTFTREHLLHTVWGSSAKWQRTTTVTEHVRRLRNRIERDPLRPERIVTVRGTGYRFETGPLSPARPAAAAREVGSLDAIIVIVGSTITYASPSALELLGDAPAERVVGHDVFEFVAPQSLGAAHVRHAQEASERWPRPEIITLQRLDDTELLVEVASSPVTWDGQPASQVTMWDLSEDTARLRTLATGIHADVQDAVVVTSVDLCVQSFNDAAEELYGWRESEIIGRRLADVIPWAEPASFDRANERVFADGRWHGETVQVRRDREPMAVRTSMTLLRDNVGEPVGVVGVHRPVRHAADGYAQLSQPDAPLDAEIRRGIEHGEFTVHYQPIVWLENGHCGGVEALVRWEHPTRGLLAPAAFIAAAERSGAIVELGDAVLRMACCQVQRWRERGLDLHLSVNLSVRQLTDTTLPDRIDDVMRATGVPDGKLWLEVTETALVQDFDVATTVLHKMEELGACLSIDDFGTGWASLTYLREFAVHALKIDRLFVSGLGEHGRDATIVRSIISLGNELGVVVSAEGVETEAQRTQLLALGCEIAQGYLFGAPMPPDELEAYLTR